MEIRLGSFHRSYWTIVIYLITLELVNSVIADQPDDMVMFINGTTKADGCPPGKYLVWRSCKSCVLVCPDEIGRWEPCKTKCPEVYDKSHATTTTTTTTTTPVPYTESSRKKSSETVSLVLGITVPILIFVIVMFILYKKCSRFRRLYDETWDVIKRCGKVSPLPSADNGQDLKLPLTDESIERAVQGTLGRAEEDGQHFPRSDFRNMNQMNLPLIVAPLISNEDQEDARNAAVGQRVSLVYQSEHQENTHYSTVDAADQQSLDGQSQGAIQQQSSAQVHVQYSQIPRTPTPPSSLPYPITETGSPNPAARMAYSRQSSVNSGQIGQNLSPNTFTQQALMRQMSNPETSRDPPNQHQQRPSSFVNYNETTPATVTDVDGSFKMETGRRSFRHLPHS